MSENCTKNRISVEELRSLFQDRVSLIAVRPGSKEMAQKWSIQPDGSYPEANTNNRQLAAMGIAVQLGNKTTTSSVLILMDLLRMGSKPIHWLSVSLNSTRLLRRHSYPKDHVVQTSGSGSAIQLKEQNLRHRDVVVGEFRSDGGLTIIQRVACKQS